MTVADLIKILQKVPADATVVTYDSDYGYCTPIVSLDDDGEVVISLG